MKLHTLHVIRVKYLGATNTLGSRVKITSDRFKQSITIPFDHQYNNCEDMAAAELIRRGFNVIALADCHVITDTFKPFKE
jgi:hypothetical protein